MIFKSKFLRRLTVFLIFCVFGMGSAVHAKDIVIMTGEWKPYVSATLDGYGFTAEVVSQAFLAVGIRPTIKIAPWTRCESMVKNGKAFAAFPYTKNELRVVFANFSEPIAVSRTVFFYRKDKLGEFDFTHLNNLKSFLLGGTRGYYYEPMFKKAGLLVDYADDEATSFRKLYRGRIDLLPVNELVGWELVRKLFPDNTSNIAITKSALTENKLSLMVSKKYPGAEKLLKKFNDGLKRIKENGIYLEIFKKYNISEEAGFFEKDE